MSEESSFSKGFGLSCGCMTAVIAAILGIPMVLCGGCMCAGFLVPPPVQHPRPTPNQSVETSANTPDPSEAASTRTAPTRVEPQARRHTKPASVPGPTASLDTAKSESGRTSNDFQSHELSPAERRTLSRISREEAQLPTLAEEADEELSAAQKLALLDTGIRIPDNDPRVVEYAERIKNIKRSFPAATENEIAGLAFAVQKQLKQKEINQSLLQITELLSLTSRGLKPGSYTLADLGVMFIPNAWANPDHLERGATDANAALRELQMMAEPQEAESAPNDSPVSRKASAQRTTPRDVATELRTWTDSTGKFSVQARFVGYGSGKVKLQKEDGSEAEVPIERLSEGDKEYLRQRWRERGLNAPF